MGRSANSYLPQPGGQAALGFSNNGESNARGSRPRLGGERSCREPE